MGFRAYPRSEDPGAALPPAKKKSLASGSRIERGFPFLNSAPGCPSSPHGMPSLPAVAGTSGLGASVSTRAAQQCGHRPSRAGATRRPGPFHGAGGQCSWLLTIGGCLESTQEPEVPLPPASLPSAPTRGICALFPRKQALAPLRFSGVLQAKGVPTPAWQCPHPPPQRSGSQFCERPCSGSADTKVDFSPSLDARCQRCRVPPSNS